MPSMQVFFVAAPGMILVGFALLALAVPATLGIMVETLADWLLGLSR
jgi:flagellar biosynthesis protein FliR